MDWNLVKDVVWRGVERGDGSLKKGESLLPGAVAGALGLAMDMIREDIGDVVSVRAPAVLLDGDKVEVLRLLQRVQRRLGDQLSGGVEEPDEDVRRTEGLVAVALSQPHRMVEEL